MDWLVVTSPENFACTRRLEFRVQGFKQRHHQRVLRLTSGDRIAYYLTGKSRLAGCALVRSACFEERTRIWTSPGHPEELYPWRVKIEPLVMPPEDECPQAASLVDRLEFVRKWPVAHWRLAFQGMLREIPAADFELIRGELWSLVQQKGQEGQPG